MVMGIGGGVHALMVMAMERAKASARQA
eukprot:COSAG01_NODE_4857_length_4679_cov_2.341485_1_plen_27_part_10